MKEIDPSELSEFLYRHPDALIVDVRFEHERQEVGYLEDALHVPWLTPDWEINENFVSEINRITSKHCHMVFVCRSGHRSADACRLLAEYGFTQAYNLRGGHNALALLEAARPLLVLSENFTHFGRAIAAAA